MTHKTGAFRAILEATASGRRYLKKEHKPADITPAPDEGEVLHSFPHKTSTYVNKEDLQED